MLHKYIHSFDKTRIHYIIKRSKNKHFLVFIHGVSANWTIWKKQLEFFDYAGYSYIALDLRGHGMSDRPSEEKKYIFQYFAKDIRAILKVEQIKDFTLIGHSLGGGIVLDYVTHLKKQPQAAIVIDTATVNPFEHKAVLHFNKYRSRFLRFITKHQTLKDNKKKKEIDLYHVYKRNKLILAWQWIKQCPLKVIITVLDKLEEHTQQHGQQTIKRLRRLKTPVLVISSLFDPIVSARYGEDISKYAKNAVFRIIKGVNHAVVIDKADEVNTTLLKFLQK